MQKLRVPLQPCRSSAACSRDVAALVTGAASGIGLAVANAFRAAGAVVTAADISGGGDIVRCDVREEAEVAALFASSGAGFTDVVHAAGVAESAPIEQVSLDSWHLLLETNLTGSFLVGREVSRRISGPGTLTFIASAGGLHGTEQWTAYTASKFGVVGLMRAMAREMAPRRLRVNAVCPTGVRTPMSDKTILDESTHSGRPAADVRADHNRSVPIGRMAEPEEIASVCVFLASDLAAHVAGVALPVDGAELA